MQDGPSTKKHKTETATSGAERIQAIDGDVAASQLTPNQLSAVSDRPMDVIDGQVPGPV
jgi:hypothetical protein